MNKIKLSLIGIFLLTHVGCVNESNLKFDKENSVKVFSKEEKSSINQSYIQAKKWMDKRDLTKAEAEFDKIFKIIPHNLYNDDYIFALLAETKLYARFQLLDRAEFTTLKACGLSDKLADKISKISKSSPKSEAESIIKTLENNIDKENYYGFHVAKTFVHKIFSIEESDKYNKLRKEVTQRKYDLHLYPSLVRVRSIKMKGDQKLTFLKEKLKTAKGDDVKKIEDGIAMTNLFLGRFDKALAIADRSLAKDKNDINSLFIKMNIAMSSGKYDEMKEYENRIRKIKPEAFREKSTSK